MHVRFCFLYQFENKIEYMSEIASYKSSKFIFKGLQRAAVGLLPQMVFYFFKLYSSGY